MLEGYLLAKIAMGRLLTDTDPNGIFNGIVTAPKQAKPSENHVVPAIFGGNYGYTRTTEF